MKDKFNRIACLAKKLESNSLKIEHPNPNLLKEKKERMARLEKDYLVWMRYYFPHYFRERAER